MSSEVSYALKAMELIANDMTAYPRGLTRNNFLELVPYHLWRPVPNSLNYVKKKLRRVKQRWNHRCKYCNNFGPIWELRSSPNEQGMRPFIHEICMKEISRGACRGCPYCNSISEANSLSIHLVEYRDIDSQSDHAYVALGHC